MHPSRSITRLAGFAVAAAVAVTSVVVGAGVAVAVPSNDNCSAASVITSLPTSFTADNNTATVESGDFWNSTVWYSYTPSVTGFLAVSATSITPGGWDNTLRVWTGRPFVVANDDYYGHDVMLSFEATSGTSTSSAWVALGSLPPEWRQSR